MRAYFDLCIIKYFLNVISPNNDHHHEHPLQAALLRSLQWVSDRYVSPSGDNLLWEAAWLRRDAIASYVCLVCCNSQLNNSKSQAKPRIIPNSKFKTPHSDALPSDTIFAFLTLNTMSPARNKIFGAKFLSFERAAIVCWHTANYAAEKRSVQWMTEQKSIIGLQ